MKKLQKAAACIFGALLLGGGCTAPGGVQSGTSDGPAGASDSEEPGASGSQTERPAEEKEIIPLSFEGIGEAEDLDAFISEVDKPDGTHDNDEKETGVILSPYFSLTADGKEVDCYAVRTTYGAHSFAMLDAGADAFPLGFSLSVRCAAEDIGVLPRSYGVGAEYSSGKAAAEIPGFGNYTFVVDGDKERALTVFVREAEEFVPPEGYAVMRVSPGAHEEKLSFSSEKQVMLFESGVHFLKYNVEFLDDTEVYLERGAYICAVMPDMAEEPAQNPDWAGMTNWNALFYGCGVKNVAVRGRGMVDLSRLDWHARSAVRFDLCDGVEVEGITLNNSPEWTLYCTRSQNISISEILLFGYRQNSDGICLVDCRDGRVENCFARSGDDLFEVKSMYPAHDVPIGNLRFYNCNAWPDKARGIGIIAESQRDMADIRFENCSVGFASASWQDELGALVVYLTDKARIRDVHFENIELHSSALYPVNVTLDEASTAFIEEVYFRNIDIRGSEPVRVANNSEAGGRIGNLYFDGCTRDGVPVKTYAQLCPKLTGVTLDSLLVNRNL